MLQRSIFVLIVISLFFVTSPCLAKDEPITRTLDKFETYAQKAMRDWRVPGMSVAIVKGDHIIYSKGFGTAQAGSEVPVTMNTVFQVGSVTKAFTVALVGQLVDEGLVDWDERVVDHYPGFMMQDPWVTREFRIHDLFAQHSGMPSYVGDLQPFMGFDREHILHSMRYIKPVYSFRDKFSYVNNLFLAGAKVAELRAGSSWEDLMQGRILKPLGMKHSSVTAKGYEEAESKAVMHLMVDGSPMPMKPGMPIFDWPYIYGPAGGLNTSAGDMAKWLTAQMHDGQYGKTRIFSKETAAYMHAPVTPVAMGPMQGYYCQGWMRQRLQNTEIIWHNGNAAGGKSFIGFSPELGVGIVVLTNLGGHSLPDALAYQLFDMLSGVESPDWSATFLPDEEEASEVEPEQPVLPGFALDAYAGKYSDPVYGDMTVTSGKDHLVITLGSDQQFTIKATHQTTHTFAGDWPEVMPQSPLFEFVFSVDEDGDVVSVDMPDLSDGAGIGVFTRNEQEK